MADSFAPTTEFVNLETLVENLPQAILVLDNDRRTILANRMAAEFARKAPESMIGSRPGEAFGCKYSNDDERGCGYGPRCEMCFARQVAEKCMEKQSPHETSEGAIEQADRGKRELQVTACYLEGMKAIIVYINDVTELRRMERERAVAVKLKTALETAGAMCHEMNQPLQVISGYLELMSILPDQSDQIREFLGASLKQLARLRKIMHELNNLSSYRTKKYADGGEILDIRSSARN